MSEKQKVMGESPINSSSPLSKVKGRIWVLGDDIDTDLIVPSRVLTEREKQKLLDATLEVIIPGFARKVKKGDIIVAGKNFGCGSSREEAVFVLKELGIHAIIARSFARIFYRNAINLGIPPLEIKMKKHRGVSSESSKFSDEIEYLGKTGDIVEIDYKQSTITNKERGLIYTFQGFPRFIWDYLSSSGAINYLLNKNKTNKKNEGK